MSVVVIMSFVCRETNSIEQHSEALVSLLESCLNHNLKPSARDEDPPHAKISSDIISCIFLVSLNKEVHFQVTPGVLGHSLSSNMIFFFLVYRIITKKR